MKPRYGLLVGDQNHATPAVTEVFALFSPPSIFLSNLPKMWLWYTIYVCAWPNGAQCRLCLWSPWGPKNPPVPKRGPSAVTRESQTLEYAIYVNQALTQHEKCNQLSQLSLHIFKVSRYVAGDFLGPTRVLGPGTGLTS